MFPFSTLKKEEDSAAETVHFNYQSAMDIKSNKKGNVRVT